MRHFVAARLLAGVAGLPAVALLSLAGVELAAGEAGAELWLLTCQLLQLRAEPRVQVVPVAVVHPPPCTSRQQAGVVVVRRRASKVAATGTPHTQSVEEREQCQLGWRRRRSINSTDPVPSRSARGR